MFIVRFWVLQVVLLHTGLYYLAATLIFPDDPKNTDHDEHYFSVRRWVIGAVVLANVPNYVIDIATNGLLTEGKFLKSIATLFFVLAAWAWTTRDRRMSLIALVLLVALYPAGAIQGALTPCAACEIKKLARQPFAQQGRDPAAQFLGADVIAPHAEAQAQKNVIPIKAQASTSPTSARR